MAYQPLLPMQKITDPIPSIIHSHMFPDKPPACVHFDKEPSLIAAQVEALGGTVIRHRFEKRAYNPGLTENRWKGNVSSRYLMVYRSQTLTGGKVSVSNLNLCGVDIRGNVVWSTRLELPPIEGMVGTPMAEDGRLFWVEDQLYLAYTNVRLAPDGCSVRFKQSLVQLRYNILGHGQPPSVYVGKVIKLPLGHNHPQDAIHEKNWQFFREDGKLKTVYSICPHVVIDIERKTTWVTDCQLAKDWKATWGEPHGGTPPIRIGNQYLSFFNSSVTHTKNQRRYVIGAYMFSTEDGRNKITAMTNRPLLIGSLSEGFLWESPVHWEPIVVFACGAVMNANEEVLISYGVNDCFSETATIPLKSILSAMTPVS